MNTEMSTQENDDPDEVLCLCSGTTRGEIIDMARAGMDLEAISRRTGALSGCAGCEWDVEQLVSALQQNTNQPND